MSSITFPVGAAGAAPTPATRTVGSWATGTPLSIGLIIAYENVAITAQQKGEQLEFVVPDQTILIENPVAIVTESANPEKAQAFIDFLRTPKAQRIFGEKGYRSVLPEVLAEFDYPEPSSLFTIADHGGWPEVAATFFDPENGLFAGIVQQ